MARTHVLVWTQDIITPEGHVLFRAGEQARAEDIKEAIAAVGFGPAMNALGRKDEEP